MDTLCVPAAPEYKHVRKQAIRNMSHVYKSATKVVVLDSELLQCSKDASMLELYTRIKLSGWMRRLWTLQEGVLAYDVYFQLKDGVHSMIDVFNGQREEMSKDNQIIYTRFDQDAASVFSPFLQNHRFTKFYTNSGKAIDISSSYVLENIWKASHWRSTSHRGDEAICLATLLGLDPLPLLNIPDGNHEQRMIELLRMMPDIPMTILFQPPPQLSIKGFRWAPSSLLASFRNAQALPTQRYEVTGKLGPHGTGLIVKMPGLMLDPGEPRFDYTEMTGFVVGLTSDLSQFFDIQFVPGPMDGDRGFTLNEQNQPAIVLNRSLHSRSSLTNVFGVMVFLDNMDTQTGNLNVIFYRMCYVKIIQTESRLQLLQAGEGIYKWAAPVPETYTWHIS
jgi:hypothetical protein